MRVVWGITAASKLLIIRNVLVWRGYIVTFFTATQVHRASCSPNSYEFGSFLSKTERSRSGRSEAFGRCAQAFPGAFAEAW